MKLARRNRCCESSLDESLHEVGALLAVDDAGERAVLALDEVVACSARTTARRSPGWVPGRVFATRPNARRYRPASTSSVTIPHP
jgi:hypothetical protein